MKQFARVADGRERWNAHDCVPRHRHAAGYVALVLRGGYEECGSRGRFRVGPGDVLLHDAFDAHLDRFGRAGAELLNLAMPGPLPRIAVGCVADPDAIARAAERDPREAGEMVRAQLRAKSPAPEDWPEVLAAALLDDPGRRLDGWARQEGLAAETVSRGFGRVFGVTPAAFRAEARARRAFALIVGHDTPLAAIAAATGFADQAHMSRAVRRLTGAPPGAWRTSNRFKTAAAPAR